MSTRDRAAGRGVGERRVRPEARRGTRLATRLETLAGLATAAAAALLWRPYMGLFGDTRIYVGRALATLDPAGVGRDLMFAFDRQSGFSVFPAILTRLAAMVGAPAAAQAVSFLAVVAWTAAAALFLRRFGAGARWVRLGALLAAPAAYGGFQLYIGEAAPLPRPFAEACVILGLWAMIGGRRWTAIGLMGVAALLHPIMALPGLGVVFVLLCLDDRRWLVPAALAAVAAVAAAALHAPVLDRLLVGMDGDWLRVLRACSPFLFLRLWPPEVWTQIVVQTATLAMAAVLLDGRPRQVVIATLVVVAGALAVAAVLGDGAARVLIVQAQPWRALWLLSFLAAAAFPIVALRLWEGGALARLAAGALACAWLSVLLPVAALASAAASIALLLMRGRVRAVSAPLVLAGWGLLGALAVVVLAEQTFAIAAPMALPEPGRLPFHVYAILDVYRAAAMVLVLAGGMALARAAWSPWIALAGGAAALLFALLNWDVSDAGRRLLVSSRAATEVRAIVAARPGAVQWIGGDLEAVMLAGRPAWQTEIQAASSVFSRTQALIWEARTRRLVTTGVGPPSLLSRFPHERPPRLWTPSAGALGAFCGFADAPAWVVEPLGPKSPIPAGASVWRAPSAEGRAIGGAVVLVDRYAFIPCHAPPPPPHPQAERRAPEGRAMPVARSG